MNLYYAKNSCALASHIALEETGEKYTAVELDLSKGQQASADYKQINPKGRVPSLVTEHGILTETPAILNYIGRIYPHAKLLPEGDMFAMATLESFNSYLCSTVHVAHAHGARGDRWSDDDFARQSMQAKVPEAMTACFNLIQDELFKGPWVMGNQYTICDPYLFTLCRWLKWDGIELTDFPQLKKHFNAMSTRPAIQAVLPLHH